MDGATNASVAVRLPKARRLVANLDDTIVALSVCCVCCVCRVCCCLLPAFVLASALRSQ